MSKKESTANDSSLQAFIDTYLLPALGVDESMILGYGKFVNIPYPYPPTIEIPADLRTTLDRNYAKLMSGISAADIYFCSSIFKEELGLDRNKKVIIKRAKRNFRGWIAFIADDVGTKIAMERFLNYPEPTFVVETSPGNYQYIYVLKVPEKDFALVMAFLQQAEELKLTDAGGLQATKLGRLPTGRNNKPENNLWPVKRAEGAGSGAKYTLFELAEGFGMNIKRLKAAQDGPTPQGRGSVVPHTPPGVMPSDNESKSLTGALVDAGLLTDAAIDEGTTNPDGWMQLTQCAWSSEHGTDPGKDGDGSGISPVGYGGADYIGAMQYRCFHDSCRNRTIPQLARRCVDQGWIDANAVRVTLDKGRKTARSELARGMKDWVYVQGKVVDLSLDVGIRGLPYDYHEKKVCHWVLGGDPKKKPVSIGRLWLHDPDKKIADDFLYSPGETKLFERSNGTYINEYRKGEIQVKECSPQVAQDMDWLFEMVCPVEDNGVETQMLFKALLAKKLREPQWHIPIAILSISTFQGTGRGTIGAFMSALLGSGNHQAPTNKQLIESDFNGYMKTCFLEVSEFYSRGAGTHNRIVEAHLRHLISEKELRINEKNRPEYTIRNTALVYLCANHYECAKLVGGDRRYFVIHSPRDPAAKKWAKENSRRFLRLQTYLADNQRLSEIAGYFSGVEVGMLDRLDRAPQTLGLSESVASTATGLDRALATATRIGGVWTSHMMMSFLDHVSVAEGGETISHRPTMLRNMSTEMRRQGWHKSRRKVEGGVVRYWWISGEGRDWRRAGAAEFLDGCDVTLMAIRGVSPLCASEFV